LELVHARAYVHLHRRGRLHVTKDDLYGYLHRR
jgi:hypothetical protein